jgi:hypothetical protein
MLLWSLAKINHELQVGKFDSIPEIRLFARTADPRPILKIERLPINSSVFIDDTGARSFMR